ncbi:anti-sigma factor RsiW [Lipingzhangella halophila]|uniref:Anti-sigma factor RsiW n=1 Tax=Lipingzhangella halophila TaxID=1783352 RepID=A0A7W7RDA8_9ACTN|nr:anti-sigma factor [Lipingzhangella halophila]MBB4929875.1 anti-sigma factor RsiW [Lipingzhangella halophila]
MDHLGERLSALVDGELGHADRDRALRHLASCENCRFEAEMLRRLKRRLHGLDGPEPSTDFMGRLSALEEPPSGEPPLGPPPSDHGAFGTRPPLGSSRPLGGGVPGTSGGGGHLAAPDPAPAEPKPEPASEPDRRSVAPLSLLRPRWGRTRYAVAGVSMVALTLGTAFFAGDEPQEAPVVRPDIEDYEVEHAVVSGQAPDLHTRDAPGVQRALDDPAPDETPTPW